MHERAHVFHHYSHLALATICAWSVSDVNKVNKRNNHCHAGFVFLCDHCAEENQNNKRNSNLFLLQQDIFCNKIKTTKQIPIFFCSNKTFSAENQHNQGNSNLSLLQHDIFCRKSKQQKKFQSRHFISGILKSHIKL